ncbi:alpha/beta fold hydrolase [Nonomuraea lactucae]|uniref:alpha/beta fold hydrolase n=1 Tax=Nonomuraea lactucae TaxID=2249762 RepID=UPI000DE5481D|nr:alpha/beta fold hydrolase [Nonomuraea lactucae]
MATYLLVHGSFAGGWIWSGVRDLLQDGGHQVRTPTLTGLGERAHEAERTTGLSTHVDDVTRVLRGLDDVILVGHSYGGMVISGVAEREPRRIRSLVYLDAFVPERGQSCFDILPWLREALAPGETDYLMPPPPPELLGVEEPRFTPMPLGTHTEPSAAGFPELPSVYVHCTGQPFFAEVAAALAVRMPVRTLDTGHLPMLTAPAATAALLAGLEPHAETPQRKEHRTP